jgi:hypothetical protein
MAPNGGYAQHLSRKDTQFLGQVAKHDVRKMHRCLSTTMFTTLGKLSKRDVGENCQRGVGKCRRGKISTGLFLIVIRKKKHSLNGTYQLYWHSRLYAIQQRTRMAQYRLDSLIPALA